MIVMAHIRKMSIKHFFLYYVMPFCSVQFSVCCMSVPWMSPRNSKCFGFVLHLFLWAFSHLQFSLFDFRGKIDLSSCPVCVHTDILQKETNRKSYDFTANSLIGQFLMESWREIWILVTDNDSCYSLLKSVDLFLFSNVTKFSGRIKWLWALTIKNASEPHVSWSSQQRTKIQHFVLCFNLI